MVEPPQAEGAPVLLFVKTPLQPPLADTEANQVEKAVLIAAWDWQAAAVVFVGQISTTVGAAATVKVAWQVVPLETGETGAPFCPVGLGAQLFVYVKVTVVEPPQAEGAPTLLLVKTPLQPPLADAVANQVEKAELIAACDWQAAAVVFVGQVSTTVGAAATVNVAWKVLPPCGACGTPFCPFWFV